MDSQEAALVADADARATAYLNSVQFRRVSSDQVSIDMLVHFDEALPEAGLAGAETLALLGLSLIQSQNGRAVASATPERKLAASLS
jgi:hypothetical protein